MTIMTDVTESSLPLDLTINKYGVGGVTGLSPTVAIRLVATGTPQYLDWATLQFQTTGWTTKYQAMTGLERGHYQQLLPVAGIVGVTGGMKFVAEYDSAASGFQGDTHEIIQVNNVAQYTNYLRKIAHNRLEEASGATGTLILYDDDGVTPITTWALKDETGGAVLPATGTPAKRSAGTP